MVKLCFNDYSVLMMFMSFRSAVACFARIILLFRNTNLINNIL